MRNIRFIKGARKSAIVCGAALLLLGAIAQQPSVVSYAAEAQTIGSYGQAQVKTLGSWEQQTDGRWKFKQFTGSYLTSSWIESQSELGAWYFVDANGYMLTSTTTPDGYYVDANGVWRATQGGSNSGSQGQSGENSNQQTDNRSSNQNQQENNNNGGSNDGNNGDSGNNGGGRTDRPGSIKPGDGRLNNSPSILNQ